MPKIFAKFNKDSKTLPLDEVMELLSDKGVKNKEIYKTKMSFFLKKKGMLNLLQTNLEFKSNSSTLNNF